MPEIEETLREYNVVFSINDLRSIFKKNYLKWKLPTSTQFKQFYEFIIERKKMMTLVSLPRGNRFIINDSKKPPTVLEVASNLYSDSYISHYSAVSYHGLTKEIIKSVYSSKYHSSGTYYDERELSQEDIDIAFSNSVRTTSQYFDYQNYRVYLLNSKNEKLGITADENIKVTSIERTLIDIAVRPQYCGGVYEVLNVYKNAEGMFSINKLRAYLKELDYLYPYHQVVGFYLEKAGYREGITKLIESIPMNYDFYLTHSMENPEYNERWKIYYPSNFGN